MRTFAIIALLALAWATPGSEARAATPAAAQHFVVDAADVEVSGDLQGFRLHIATRKASDGVTIATLKLSRDTPAPPPSITLKWSTASSDIVGMWTPAGGTTIGPDWAKGGVNSTLTADAPVLTLFGRDGRNRMTVAVADALNPLQLSARLREEDVRVYSVIELFAERHRAVTNYSTEIRFDTRAVPFSKALQEVAAWWEKHEGYAPAPAPADASEPLDSTWYSYHQNVPYERVIAEADQAAKLGFKVLIVDDGWQTNDGNRGYAYTGDWQPDRLGDMKRFTDALHARGLKAMLWYSVPFVGDKAAIYPRFKGKYLKHAADLNAHVLDPRYPEVRAYLIETYRRAVQDWGIDGLKLDFIDMFKSEADTVLNATEGRDYASVYEAVDRLMGDVMVTLRRINPAVLIEFRQPYAGPLIRKYGNMLRASDTPNGSIINRQKIVDLRLLSGATPVHADPIVWHAEEPAEIAAFQLLDTLFSVPQVSMRLHELTPAHVAMLKNYLAYWRDNKQVLLGGSFEPDGVLERYPVVAAASQGKRIVGLYADRVVKLTAPAPAQIDIVNAKASTRIVIDAATDLGEYEVIVTDVFGVAQAPFQIQISKGLSALTVPVSGIARLRQVALP